MPVIREYNSQVSAGSVGKLRSEDNPYRASQSVGSGLRDVGRAVGMVGDAYQRVQEQRDTSNLQVKVAEARSRVTTRLQEAARSGNILAEDFDEAFSTSLAEDLDGIQSEMTTPLGRQAAAVHSAQLRAHFLENAAERKALAFGEKAKSDFIVSRDQNANTLVSDPTQFQSIYQDTAMSLAADDGPYAALPRQLRQDLLRETGSVYAGSALAGIIDADPARGRQQLLEGQWDPYITPGQKIQLINRAESKQAEKDSAARFEALVQLQDAANNGELSTATLKRAVDAKVISPEKGISLREHSKRRAEEIERQRLLTIAIDRGDPMGLVGYTPREQQEGFDLWAGRLMQGATDDKTKVAAGNRIVSQGRELNLMSSQHKAMFDTASPLRPAQFHEAAKWYDVLRTIDPAYAASHVNSKQAAVFDVYSTALAAGQGGPAAIEIVKQAGDPEKLKEFRKNLSAAQLKDIENAIDPYFGSPASNTAWARNQIAEMTKLRMAFGDTPVEQAAEWATSQFKARHTLVGGRWLPKQGATSPDVADALNEYLTRVPAALQKTGGYTQDDVDPEGYELRTDRLTSLNGSLQVYAKSTGMAVPGWRVSSQEALQAYQGVKETKAKAQTEEAARKFKALRDQGDDPLDVGGVLLR